MNLRISPAHAKNFLLTYHGLVGEPRFQGHEGIIGFVRQAGCIQFDPVDSCGRNADLVLQARIPDYRPSWLYNELYDNRRLVDYFDKNMAIFSIEDWPYFERMRKYFRAHPRLTPTIRNACAEILRQIADNGGVLTSQDADIPGKVDWSWAPTKLSRAALEALYFQGDLIIHHKVGTIKHYAPTREHIPAEILNVSEPHPHDGEYVAWHVKRRIGAVGMLWNRPSDAWLAIMGMSGETRKAAFSLLEQRGDIIPVHIDGLKDVLYIRREDEPLLQTCITKKNEVRRLEFIAPLDNIMWDRRLIEAFFGFSYKWEIYTPQADRKYGWYVLPVLWNGEFIGRIEMTADRKQKVLAVKGFWPEKTFSSSGKDNRRQFTAALEKRLEKFAAFNGCIDVQHTARS
ncbi:winged helix-turn-helix domain-containing protein [Parasphaerochaeta coccoides]|uniref:Winged helix-turn-helix domain-containing protein n=1 Tax=Parasphaerochaeta coccoides (strain ATCC BAA-1237 / DSM 17374 / SPN1) TaxID=760011 RepID=F4GHK5_PARC1|nr:winged helix DNA-binding domain-containing protein [Parasphaerochaeta coccoides]AEC02594.1 protein of unknown function DUF1006 [Parasphaerochaeta coccoides DSM 17374]